MNYFKKLIFVFFSVMLLLSTSLIVIAKSDKNSSTNQAATYIPRIVKVGISDSPYYSIRMEDGTYTGIMIDYLQEISKYAGWRLEYVECSPNELNKKLENGEIDITDGILKNSYTLDKYDFANYNSGYSYTILAVLKDNDKYVPMDYNSFQGMKVGVFLKSNRISAYHAFVESNKLDVTTVYYDSSEELNKALYNGEIDAILTNDTSIAESEQSIAKFGAIPYYFGVTKGNSVLLKELNSALSTILEVNPKFDDMVYEKFFNNVSRKLVFSKEEKTFIENSPPLKVAIISSLAPIEYYNFSTNKAEGISPDILATISSLTGLSFQFVPVTTLTEAKSLLQNGEVDLIAGPNHSDSENGMGIVFTRQYLNTQEIMIHQSNPQKKGLNTYATLDGYSPNKLKDGSKNTVYKTSEECIQAVISGNAEYTFINNLIADHYTYLRGNEHVSLTPITKNTEGLRFGVAQPADPLLLSIIDKTIYSITNDDLQNIVYENTTSNSVNVTLTSLLYTYTTTFVIIILGIFIISLITIILLALFIRTKLKLTKQIAVRGDSYRIISELTDEYIYDFDFDSGILTLPKDFSILTGLKINYTQQQISSGNNKIIKALYSTFPANNKDSQTNIDFMCPLADAEDAWFKAVGTVIWDSNKKPLRGIGRIRSIQKEKSEKEELEIKAHTDSLTKLFNKQYSEQKILEYLEQHSDSNKGVLMIIDLDYFKTINDTLGHIAGDEVLKLFSKTLTSQFDSDGIIGRWGGDEFIVFIKEIDEESKISLRAEQLCKLMNREFHYEGKSHLLSISIGIALANKASSYQELFQNADTALYHVKNAERNGYKIY